MRALPAQLEPAEVARAAADAGVTVMSLTDHDGIAGVAAATDGPYGTGGYAVLCRPMRRRESTRLAAIGRETR